MTRRGRFGGSRAFKPPSLGRPLWCAGRHPGLRPPTHFLFTSSADTDGGYRARRTQPIRHWAWRRFEDIRLGEPRFERHCSRQAGWKNLGSAPAGCGGRAEDATSSGASDQDRPFGIYQAAGGHGHRHRIRGAVLRTSACRRRGGKASGDSLPGPGCRCSTS
jgi:hypothetical protein